MWPWCSCVIKYIFGSLHQIQLTVVLHTSAVVIRCLCSPLGVLGVPLPSFLNSNRLWAPVPCSLPLPHHQTSANSCHQLQSFLHSGFPIILPSKSSLISIPLHHLTLSMATTQLYHIWSSSHHYPTISGTQSPFMCFSTQLLLVHHFTSPIRDG